MNKPSFQQTTAQAFAAFKLQIQSALIGQKMTENMPEETIQKLECSFPFSYVGETTGVGIETGAFAQPHHHRMAFVLIGCYLDFATSIGDMDSLPARIQRCVAKMAFAVELIPDQIQALADALTQYDFSGHQQKMQELEQTQKETMARHDELKSTSNVIRDANIAHTEAKTQLHNEFVLHCAAMRDYVRLVYTDILNNTAWPAMTLEYRQTIADIMTAHGFMPTELDIRIYDYLIYACSSSYAMMNRFFPNSEFSTMALVIARTYGVEQKDITDWFAREDLHTARLLVSKEVSGRTNAEFEAMARESLPAYVYEFYSKYFRLEEGQTLDFRKFLQDTYTVPAKPNLQLDDFDYLNAAEQCLELLKNDPSAKLYLVGRPGTGKTEFASAMIAALTAQMENSEGTFLEIPLDKKIDERMSLIRLSKTVRTGARILVDESDSILNVDTRSEDGNPKSQLIALLEDPEIGGIFIGNDLPHDEAITRRFTLIINFPKTPKSVNERILRRKSGGALPEALIERILMVENVTPAIVTRLCQNYLTAQKFGDTDPVRVVTLTLAGMLRKNTSFVLPELPTKEVHMLELVNADFAVDQLFEQYTGDRPLRVALTGLPGTGKTAFCLAFANKLNKKLIIKTAADIFGMYVGETEKNIQEAFHEAEELDAVLLIDEVDSFLQDRKNAVRSWERTSVNQFLTSLDAYKGIFFCTTNDLDGVDPAALRRLHLKVRFKPLTDASAVTMLKFVAGQMSVELTDADIAHFMNDSSDFTFGDFAAVRAGLSWMNETTLEQMLSALYVERSYRVGHSMREVVPSVAQEHDVLQAMPMNGEGSGKTEESTSADADDEFTFGK